MEPIIAKLDRLSEIKAAAEVTRLDYEAKRAEIMKAVQTQLDDLAAEFEPLIKSAEERAADLEVEIKRDVLTQGASIKGRRLYAVFSRGRVSWDTDRFLTTAKNYLRRLLHSCCAPQDASRTAEYAESAELILLKFSAFSALSAVKVCKVSSSKRRIKTWTST